MSVTIYHNPRCSKSRETLAILESKQVETTVVEYLKSPPDATELKRILDLLGISARELIRTGESPYKDLGLADPEVPEASLIEAMVAHPILIQRPIVISGNRAVIGRPPERVLDIL
ncbi:MAG: arsenate reductase (glutaredoxin) [Gammaproteobacteria bacterium]